jgi:osmotically-inducible protein OsmY
MIRSSFALALAAAVLTGCGTDTATQESEPPKPVRPPVERTDDRAPAAVAPDSAADREIRRQLNSAITADPQLKDRHISFLVTNGDVSVTGEVNTEDERRRMNDLAMDIAGVKSVANALRVED